MAVASIIREAQSCIKRELRDDDLSVQHDLATKQSSSKEHRIKNESRQYEAAFQCPGNGHSDIDQKSLKFRDFVCSRIGCVSDCYILHAKILADPFVLVKSEDYLDLAHSDSGKLRSRKGPKVIQALLEMVRTHQYIEMGFHPTLT